MAVPIERIPASPLTAPKVQRKIPDPYTRPALSIGGTSGARRQWRQIPVTAVRAGDTVAGVGLVTDTQEKLVTPNRVLADPDVTWTITLTNIEGVGRVYGGHETVLCFTQPPAVEQS